MKRIETVTLPVIEIKTGFGNPRKISTNKRNELKESLDKFGDFGLILIDEDNNVIAGNQKDCCRPIGSFIHSRIKEKRIQS